jgi:hypothetical protein
MVYFEDMNTVIDVPLEEMETFLNSEEHGSAHSEDVRNFEVVENAGQSVVLAYERRFEGQWSKSKTRMTMFPPYVACVEELEGIFAGSKFFVVHRPDGKKTRVDVFGEAHCESKSPEELRTIWLNILSKAHDEDLSALGKVHHRK